jgi:Tol biopolymer transport system component
MKTIDRGIRIGSVVRARVAVLFVAALAAVSPSAPGQFSPTTRVSVDSSGAEGNGFCNWTWISGDGRTIVFESGASNLVAGDTNGKDDVFVHDRTTGVTECVSVDPYGVPGDAGGGAILGEAPSMISADGRYVVFCSGSTNLIAGTTSSPWQLYLRDRTLGTTEMVSVDAAGKPGDSWSTFGTISADGRYVAFESGSTNLVAGDTNQRMDVFLRDRTAGTTDLLSVDASGTLGNDDSASPLLSADGTTVAFSSYATNLVPNDTNGSVDSFVCTLATRTLERISVDPNGAEGDSHSSAASISADGSVVAFWSIATNLVPGDTNGVGDCFVHDCTAGVTERVSVDSSGSEADLFCFVPAISADGRYVAFSSFATNLVVNDTNGKRDVFLHDRVSGVTTRESVDSSGVEEDGPSSEFPSISADGTVLSFVSSATNLVPGDTNGKPDVFVRDRHVASWTNYGNGVAGTNGVPGFTASAAPVIGTTTTLALDNSSGAPTLGLLFAGFQRANLPTGRGGDLLVLPVYVLPISFSFGADTFDWVIPADPMLAGLTLDLQAVEADAAAPKGVSFTAGLELVVGY